MANERSVLLVGSVPLPTARDVFETVAASLGESAPRIPDGEVGERLEWILCQQGVVDRAQGLERAGERVIQGNRKFRQYKLPVGGRASAVSFGPLGYAEWAKSSYADFERLKSQGRVPKATRFQVSLPSPLDVVNAFFSPSDVKTLWPVYERAMIAEVDEIARVISHAELAIQWDMSTEFQSIMENPERKKKFPPQEMADAIARVSDHVPATAELGLHCCYGDPGHKHIVEPTDTANMVELCNLFVTRIRRQISWIHMPVPKERDDDAYFAPLRNLKLKSGTQLYLGLVHMTDGIEGARRRLAAAKKVVSEFGIATECGFGRRPPETLPALLNLHRDVAQLG